MADTAHREELSCASAATLRLSQDGASSLLDIAGLMIHQIQWTDKPLSHVPAWHSMLHSIYIYIYRCKKAFKWGQRTRRHATLSFELVSIGKKNPHWQRTRDGPLCLWVSVLQPWWLDLPLSWGPFSRRCFLVYRKGALRDFAPRELA